VTRQVLVQQSVASRWLLRQGKAEAFHNLPVHVGFVQYRTMAKRIDENLHAKWSPMKLRMSQDGSIGA
jgi:hypothetical protein